MQFPHPPSACGTPCGCLDVVGVCVSGVYGGHGWLCRYTIIRPHMTFIRAWGEMSGSEGKHATPPSPQCMWHTMWLISCGWGACEWSDWWSWLVVQVHLYTASHDLHKGMGGDEWIRR
jgi:hypothetical protein